MDRVLDDWLSTSGPKHVMNAAEHYGIFKDILMDCSFIPKLNFEVTYTTNQVQWGNILFPEKVFYHFFDIRVLFYWFAC